MQYYFYSSSTNVEKEICLITLDFENCVFLLLGCTSDKRKRTPEGTDTPTGSVKQGKEGTGAST